MAVPFRMKASVIQFAAALVILSPATLALAEPIILDGVGELETPGGKLPFEISISSPDRDFASEEIAGQCWIGTADDPLRAPLPWHMLDGDIVIEFPHYGSEIVATWNEDHTKLSGAWTKDRGDKGQALLPFSADFTIPVGFLFTRFGTFADMNIAGYWNLEFADSDEPAIAWFIMDTKGMTRATIMTPTGDYRYLRGVTHFREMRLASFDGAHADLVTLTFDPDTGRIAGDIWHGDWSHETFTGTKTRTPTLPSGFDQSKWVGSDGPIDLAFPDLDGNTRELLDPEFLGKATIIEVFGSWCPNCSDATELLSEYMDIYGDRGLRVIGLAFEVSDDLDVVAPRIRAGMQRHDADWPVLFGGKLGKEGALPVIDKIKAYPTLIFLDDKGEARYVFSGFYGPATNEEHVAMRTEFEGIIEELLTGKPRPGHEIIQEGGQ